MIYPRKYFTRSIRVYILLLLDVFCMSVRPIWYNVQICCSLIDSVWIICPLLKVEYQNLQLLLYCCLFLLLVVSICFIYLGALILGTYVLMSVISFSCINSFIIIWCLSFLWTLFYSLLCLMWLLLPPLSCSFHLH